MVDGGFESEYQEPRSNTLAIVGFVLAFCLSPIGLLLSLIALAKPPRGLAVAGVIVGLLGCVAWAMLGWLVVQVGRHGFEVAEVMEDYRSIEAAVAAHRAANNDAYPDELSQLNVDQAALTDPWGGQYRYEKLPDGKGFAVLSSGIDGRSGSMDDIRIEFGMTESEISNHLGDSIGKHYEEKYGG